MEFSRETQEQAALQKIQNTLNLKEKKMNQKKKKEKGICFCYSLTVTHLFQFSRTLSHSFCSFWLWEREIHILLKLVLEPESGGRYHYPQLLFISTSLVHFTNKQTNRHLEGKTVIIPITRCFLFLFLEFQSVFNIYFLFI